LKGTEKLPVMRIKAVVPIVSHYKHISFWHNLQPKHKTTISHMVKSQNESIKHHHSFKFQKKKLPLDPSHKLEALLQIAVLQQHHLPVVSHHAPTTNEQPKTRNKTII